MGEEVEADSVELPLRHAKRIEIIHKLEELPESIRGKRVSTLVAWVERSLMAPLEVGGFEDPIQHEITNRAIIDVERLLRDLFVAAKQVAPHIPPDDQTSYETWVTTDSLRRDFHPYEVAITCLMQETFTSQTLAGENLKKAIMLLANIEVFDDTQVGKQRPPRNDVAARIVRAVMWYRHTELLSLTITWNNAEDDKRLKKGAHRTDKQLGPASQAAVLVYEVDRAFGKRTPNKTLRMLMHQYRERYSQRKAQTPIFADVSLEPEWAEPH